MKGLKGSYQHGYEAIPVNDDLDDIPSSDSIGKRKKSVLWVVMSIVFVAIIITYAAATSGDSASSSSSDVTVDDTINADITNKDDDDDNDDVHANDNDALIDIGNACTYGVYRENYKALSYFDSSGKDNSVLQYKFLESYAGVVEPSTNTILEVYGDCSRDVSFFFTSTNYDGSGSLVRYNADKQKLDFSSIKNEIDCEVGEEIVLSIEEFDPNDGSKINTVEHKLLCLYVRRELRTLAPADKEEFLEAVRTEFYTLGSDGKEMYGDDFLTAFHMVGWHHWNTAQKSGDNIHNGLGFMLQHIKGANFFETLLQVSNKRVALPYWDFTLDSTESINARDSNIFTDDWFGTIRKPAGADSTGALYTSDKISEFGIDGGIFQDLEIGTNKKYKTTMSGYGYYRGPWNMNPSPYVSRFNYNLELPTCSNYYSSFQFTDRADYMHYASHHTLTLSKQTEWSNYGCDALSTLKINGFITVDGISYACTWWAELMKELWQEDLMVPTEGCVQGNTVESSTCSFSCTDAEKVSQYVISWFGEYMDKDQEGIDTAVSNFMCDSKNAEANKIFPSDYFDSGAPSDPMFFPAIPLMDLALHMKLMVGGFLSTEWPTDATKSYVCDTPSCYNEDTGKIEANDMCCYGHFEQDQIYSMTDGSTETFEFDTNSNVYKMLNPLSSERQLPYIYDSLSEAFQHCPENFEMLLEDHFATMKAVREGALSTDEAARKLQSDKQRQFAAVREQVVAMNTTDPLSRLHRRKLAKKLRM